MCGRGVGGEGDGGEGPSGTEDLAHLLDQRFGFVGLLNEGDVASRSDLVRFQREVRILGSLRHPSVVTIHDSGRVDGSFYYVMDFIEGQTLDAYVAANRPSPRAVHSFSSASSEYAPGMPW